MNTVQIRPEELIKMLRPEFVSSGGGSVMLYNTVRVVASPYTVLAADEIIFVDTDGGAITVNLPAGVKGKHYKVINCGSSGNNVTLTPNGVEKLFGVNAAETLFDGENVDIHFEPVENWF